MNALITNPASAITLLLIVLGIGLAGGLGAVLRLFATKLDGWLPWGIMSANALGSFTVGLASAYQLGLIGLVVTVGFAGGLSTYSAFVATTGEFLRAKLMKKAALNALGVLVFSSTAFGLGQLIALAMLK
jgi:fluoride ion exporter CrcB/FEX